MIYHRVSREQMRAILKRQADRKAKREEKRALLWPARELKRKMRTLRQIVRAVLDTLWSQIILARARRKSAVCAICGERPIEVAYHIVPKQRGDSVRWDLENGCGACSRCNRGEQLNRSLYRDKHLVIFGRELIERIEGQARIKADYSTAELQEKAREFRLILAREAVKK